MDLVPCDENARDRLKELLQEAISDSFEINIKNLNYVARTFPSILVDLVKRMADEAYAEAKLELCSFNENANETDSSKESFKKAALKQLMPFLKFHLFLGRSPQISSFIYEYFETTKFQPLPNDLFYLKDGIVVYNHFVFDDQLVTSILIAYLKYLSFDSARFASLWCWAELVRLTTCHTTPEISYLALSCLSMITYPTRLQHQNFMRTILSKQNKITSIMPNILYKARFLYENNFNPCIETQSESAIQYAKAMGLSGDGYPYSSSFAKIANVLLAKKKMNENSDSKMKSICDKFFPLATLNDILSQVAYSISINKPCFLKGPCGSGKTCLFDYVAAKTGRVNAPEYLKIQVGDQMDSRSLIGTYICSGVPGNFEWQAGPLTKAMISGSWIVFEDINLAPAEVIQLISSVIENKNLTCVPNCSVKLESPHQDFRIFFTETTPNNQKQLPESFERLCDIAHMNVYATDDLEAIIRTKYGFKNLDQQVIQLYLAAKESFDQFSNSSRLMRQITLRDIVKLCSRIQKSKINPHVNKLDSNQIETILTSAVDCFLSFLDREKISSSLPFLGQQLQLSSQQCQRIIYPKRSPPRFSMSHVEIGKIKMKINSQENTDGTKSIAYTRQVLHLLNQISICIDSKEPVLLVGETGVGKTAMVQHLAQLLKNKLVILNLSQQSDSSDLLGGFRPVSMTTVMEPLLNEFEVLFSESFSREKTVKFLRHLNPCYILGKTKGEWNKFLNVINHFCIDADKKNLPDNLSNKWQNLWKKVKLMINSLKESDGMVAMSMTFVEGSLIKALVEGHWILLDEINLAEVDVLQCLTQIIDNTSNSMIQIYDISNGISEKKIHPNFRLFACMNPATDVGKKDLSLGIRNRFTELYVSESLDTQDLTLISEIYVKNILSPLQISNFIKFYQGIKATCNTLKGIDGNPPNYNLRTFCRTLAICSTDKCSDTEKTMYESIKITFLQQLDQRSSKQVKSLLEKTLFSSKIDELNSRQIPRPKSDKFYREVHGFWITGYSNCQSLDDRYILTESIIKNIQSVARIISFGESKLPILIQGNTSVGKTSLINYLAKLTGNQCVRLNNHEHTDLEEYIGRYTMDSKGGLFFCEGVLTRAMRKGHWLILDELNLAPCELLEALNRVLDDNRELFIPETKVAIKAHPDFALFATQNPPETYSGRKLLSRAFRNRFIELSFGEIPHSELKLILQHRCAMPLSYSTKIVEVMRRLQLMRRETDCFHGKNGFMTLRDVFRWGDRYLTFKETIRDNQLIDWKQTIAAQGLILLEGRVRTVKESLIVKEILEDVFSTKLNSKKIYDEAFSNHFSQSNIITSRHFKHIFFNEEFKKMYVQLSTALLYNEPVLLCGPTGCGKTTAAQYYGQINKLKLLTYNCHQNTESSDFIGGVRPNRKKDESNLFCWMDGPLIKALKDGDLFLMDEISLADDAVLERLNSVLEPTRSITLTEKRGEEIKANKSFRFVSTMNPGGDFGKKELSTALRNRLTEIFCHEVSKVDQVMEIVKLKLTKEFMGDDKLYEKVYNLIKSFLEKFYSIMGKYDLRSILNWVDFIKITMKPYHGFSLSVQEAIINGASLVFLDQFGTCGFDSNFLKTENSVRLKKMLQLQFKRTVIESLGRTKIILMQSDRSETKIDKDLVKIKKFYLEVGPNKIYRMTKNEFVFDIPRVFKNLLKIVRAMQLDKPVLLEGDPGVGKTSIISALAKITGHNLVRFNLSEQTDISDLFGADLPDDTQEWTKQPKFSWHDGPLLRALKNSDWILLDELNLASQSVLEGLNACFDHRSEIHIPELSKIFKINRSTTRIFATQNPYNQGAARKGLPLSFLNRFISIYVEPHSIEDLELILQKKNPNIPFELISKMVVFNSKLNDLNTKRILSKSTVHDFNLRDLLYWLELIGCSGKSVRQFTLDAQYQPERFVQFVYMDRLRETSSKALALGLFETIFGIPVYEPAFRELRFGETSISLGRALLQRKRKLPPQLSNYCLLKYQLPYLESIMNAIRFKKMPILVGQTGTGKRTMLKILAGITGSYLRIISANAEMDTLELLGSFEQKNLVKDLADILKQAKLLIYEAFNSSAEKESPIWISICRKLWCLINLIYSKDKDLSGTDVLKTFSTGLTKFKELLDDLKKMSFLNKFARNINLVSEKLDSIYKHMSAGESFNPPGSFEWIDSLLVESIKDGSWVLIENANMMNPATLDRLNSLMEPNGSLYLSEKGSNSDGSVECVRPHKNFRLFLTMDPSSGELSRAMRNRGIEIFIEPSFYHEDFLMLMFQNGYVPIEDHSCMAYSIMQTCIEIHSKITSEPEAGSLLIQFALNHIQDVTHSVRRGKNLIDMLFYFLSQHYSKNGFSKDSFNEGLKLQMTELLNKYKKTHIKTQSNSSMYLWVDFKYDLFQLCACGDASATMVHRDEKLLDYYCEPEQIVKPGEYIEHIDNVILCSKVKLFLEHSTHEDLDYRLKILRECVEEKIRDCIEHFIDGNCGFTTKVRDVMSTLSMFPINISEFYIDSRNAPDFHYLLQLINYPKMKKIEYFQNRWIISNFSNMLLMLLSLNVKTSKLMNNQYHSLIDQSESLIQGKIEKQDLIRPCVEVVSDIALVIERILYEISNRSFNNEKTKKMIPRIFWMYHLLCKIEIACSQSNLIRISNQLPTTWAMTYQKIVRPLMKEIRLQDVKYRDVKLMSIMKKICSFFGTSSYKFGLEEKERYKAINNLFACTTSSTDYLKKNIMRLFSSLLDKYLVVSDDSNQAISTFNLSWSTSRYILSMYYIVEQLAEIESDSPVTDALSDYNNSLRFQDPDGLLSNLNELSMAIETDLNKIINSSTYRLDFLDISRRDIAAAQYSPIWQCELFKKVSHECFNAISSQLTNGVDLKSLFVNTIINIRGIIISPRIMYNLLRYQHHLKMMAEKYESSSHAPSDILNLYYSFATDLLSEKRIFDNQLVGWTKVRVITNDVPVIAPNFSEFSALLSFVCSYALDSDHLRISSCSSESRQLDAFLSYCWHNYHTIKSQTISSRLNLDIVENIAFLRGKAKDETINTNALMSESIPEWDKIMQCIEASTWEEKSSISDSFKMVFFGYLVYMENSPSFTIDPVLRSREKLSIYKSELAHIKVELFLRNTLFYWKTCENLRLDEVLGSDDITNYPYSHQILIKRRSRLEKRIHVLEKRFTSRPINDDGSQYSELRAEVDYIIKDQSRAIFQMMRDFKLLSTERPKLLIQKQLVRLELMAKNLEKCIINLRSKFSLYSDLLTNFISGLLLVLQGLRCLCAIFDRRMQMQKLSQMDTYNDYVKVISSIYTLSDLTVPLKKSFQSKLRIIDSLRILCPNLNSSYFKETQSKLILSLMAQIRSHVASVPMDTNTSMRLVDTFMKEFFLTWKSYQKDIEASRKKKDELYHYKKVTTTTLVDAPVEHQQLVDICINFPSYEYFFKEFLAINLTSVELEKIEIEERIISIEKEVDPSFYIEVCKTYMGLVFSAGVSNNLSISKPFARFYTEADGFLKLETDVLFTLIKNGISSFGPELDAALIDCYMMRANEYRSSLNRSDQSCLDVYVQADQKETSKLQKICSLIISKIDRLKQKLEKSYEDNSGLRQIMTIINRINSFLIQDPLVKFITGAQALLESIESWIRLQPVAPEDKFTEERDQLVELIVHWRSLESKSWVNSLAKTKDKYIYESLCQMWFALFDLFNNPVEFAASYLESESYEFCSSCDSIYGALIMYMKSFFETSTFGDYQTRLDLVACFIVRAVLTASNRKKNEFIDFAVLYNCVYNVYSIYKHMYNKLKFTLENDEKELSDKIREQISIISYQSKNYCNIRNNFKQSYKQLNRIISQYKELLKKPVILEDEKHIFESPPQLLADSELIGASICGTNLLISAIDVQSLSQDLRSTLEIIMNLHQEMSQKIVKKYSENTMNLEHIVSSNFEHIKNFFSHDVKKIVFLDEDSQEEAAEKKKLLREMYHSKRYCVNSILKELSDIGFSYRRGNNLRSTIDQLIFHSLPLIDLNHLDMSMESCPKLVSSELLDRCCLEYHQLISLNMVLFSAKLSDDLNIDKEMIVKMRGLSLDFISNITSHQNASSQHYKSVAKLCILNTRLKQIIDSAQTVQIISYSKMRKHINDLSQVIERSFLLLKKLINLVECLTYEKSIDFPDSLSIEEFKSINSLVIDEKSDNALMSKDQANFFKTEAPEVSKSVEKISQQLKTFSLRNSLNDVFTKKDLLKILNLEQDFLTVFKKLLPENLLSGKTYSHGIFKEVADLLHESEMIYKNLKQLNDAHFVEANLSSLMSKANKIVYFIKLGFQNIHKYELDLVSNKISKSAQFFEPNQIFDVLQLDDVSKSIGRWLDILNRAENNLDCHNLKSLHHMLNVYVENASSYLSISITLLHLKLAVALQSIKFFNNVSRDGLGLPVKISKDDSNNMGTKQSSSDENKGFGDDEGSKDVSNKLEKESELDGLEKAESEESSDAHQVKADDKGIEMSEDLGEDFQKDDEKTETEDSMNQQEDTDELDKEMGTVENMSNQLDESIWGDLAINEDEDDEQEDESQNNENEHDDSDVKDAKIPDDGARPTDDERNDTPSHEDFIEKFGGDAIDQAANVESNLDNKDTNTDGKEDMKGNDDLVDDANDDLVDDANDDLVDDAKDDLVDDANDQENFEDALDITDEEMITRDDMDISQSEDDIEEELNAEKSMEKSNEEKNADGKPDKSIDEIDPAENKKDSNDDFIDKQLEQVYDFDDFCIDESDVNNGLNEGGSSMKNNEDSLGISSNNECKTQKFGNVNVYDMFPVYENDPLDFDNIEEGDEKQDGSLHANEDNDKAVKPEDEKETVLENNQAVKKDKKRTAADDSSLDKSRQHQKRPKIVDAEENVEKIDQVPKNTSADKFKHIEKDTEAAIEMVDLTQDSDEDVEIPETGDQVDKNIQLDKQTSNADDNEKDLKVSFPDTPLQDEKADETEGKDKPNMPDEKIPEEDLSTNDFDSGKKLPSEFMTNYGLMKKYMSKKPTDDRNRSIFQELDAIQKDSNTKDLAPIWSSLTREVDHLMIELCQQLQIVLQPTKMSKYKGDYKTGKRLNMRKIISYIASHYRKDKIWLRRTKPNKRNYQIALAIDNSSSMNENNCKNMTFQTLALLAKAFSVVEVGRIGIVSFGQKAKLIHDFSTPYSSEIGASWLNQLKFDEPRTSYASMLQFCNDTFNKLVNPAPASDTVTESRLIIIISDGRNFTSEETAIKDAMVNLRNQGIMVLFLIIDNSKNNDSIVNMKKVVDLDEGTVKMVDYLEGFPFPFYILLRDLSSMPSIIGESIRQWFEITSNV